MAKRSSGVVSQLYCVFDSKTDVFFPPFTGVNDASVMRDLRMRLRGGTPMAEFPEDYSLYQIGAFDDHEGKVSSAVPPRFVCRLDVCIERPASAGEDPSQMKLVSDKDAKRAV